jgi:hypothetical protein
MRFNLTFSSSSSSLKKLKKLYTKLAFTYIFKLLKQIVEEKVKTDFSLHDQLINI